MNSISTSMHSDWAYVICMSLAHSLWIAMAFTSIAIVASRLVPRSAVNLQYLLHVSALALSLIALPVTIRVVASHSRIAASLPATNATLITQAVPSAISKTGLTGNPRSTAPTLNANLALPPSPHDDSLANPISEDWAGGEPASTGEGWLHAFAPWLLFGYCVGVVLMLSRLGFAVIKAKQLVSNCTELTDGFAVQTNRDLADRWSLHQVPRLFCAQDLHVPQVVGLLRPAILLPARTLTGLSEQELAMILAHELSHVRRNDMWVQLLQRVSEAVLFFNPAAWVLSRRISRLREYCCDQQACQMPYMAADEARVVYAQALLHTVQLSGRFSSGQTTHELASLAASGRCPSELRDRILRLFGERRPVAPSTSYGVLIASSFTLAVALSVPKLWVQNVVQAAASDATQIAAPLQETQTEELANPNSTTSPQIVREGDEPLATESMTSSPGTTIRLNMRELSIQTPSNASPTENPADRTVNTKDSDDLRPKKNTKMHSASGTVVDSLGKPVPDALLCSRYRADLEPLLFGAAIAKANSMGEFSIDYPTRDVGATWVFSPGHGLRIVNMAKKFDIAGTATDVTIPLPTRAAKPKRVRVLATDGTTPVANAKVFPSMIRLPRDVFAADYPTGPFGDPPPEIQELIAVKTNADGIAEINVLEQALYSSISVLTDDFGLQSFTIAQAPTTLGPSGNREYVLRLAPCGSIHGRIECTDPEAFEGSLVYLASHVDSQVGQRWIELDGSGEFHVGKIAHGALLTVLVPVSSKDDLLLPGHREMKIVAGEELKLTFKTAPQVNVSGRVLRSDDRKPVQNARVSVTHLDSPIIRWVHTDMNGRYAFGAIPGFTYIGLADLGDANSGFDQPRYHAEIMDRLTIATSKGVENQMRDILLPVNTPVHGQLVSSRPHEFANREISLQNEHHIVAKTNTDAEGRFTLYLANWDHRYLNDQYWAVLTAPGNSPSTPPKYKKLYIEVDAPNALRLRIPQ